MCIAPAEDRRQRERKRDDGLEMPLDDLKKMQGLLK